MCSWCFMQVCDNFKPAVMESNWFCLFFVLLPFPSSSYLTSFWEQSGISEELHSGFLAFEFRLLKKIKYALNLLSTLSSSILQLWKTCSCLNRSLCLLITWIFFLTSFWFVLQVLKCHPKTLCQRRGQYMKTKRERSSSSQKIKKV